MGTVVESECFCGARRLGPGQPTLAQEVPRPRMQPEWEGMQQAASPSRTLYRRPAAPAHKDQGAASGERLAGHSSAGPRGDSTGTGAASNPAAHASTLATMRTPVMPRNCSRLATTLTPTTYAHAWTELTTRNYTLTFCLPTTLTPRNYAHVSQLVLFVLHASFIRDTRLFIVSYSYTLNGWLPQLFSPRSKRHPWG